MNKKNDFSLDIDTSINIDDIDDNPFLTKPGATPVAPAAPETINNAVAGESLNADDTSNVTMLESGKRVEHINSAVKVIESFSVKDIHEMTGISRRTLSQYFKYGIIKGNKRGKDWFATPEAVTAYMNGDYDRTEYVNAMKPLWAKLNAKQKAKRHQLKAAQAEKGN